MNITFEKASKKHQEVIFAWLKEPKVQKFWDNTEGHKSDIINFIEEQKTPSNYCNGKYMYWIASENGKPFAMLMTIQESIREGIGELKLSYISKTGNAYGVDYMIGNSDFFGKGYGGKTLAEFLDFVRQNVDSKADTFLIDPEVSNPRAKYVYEKAGFVHVADFIMEGDCSGAGKPHNLLVKRFKPEVKLIEATYGDYPKIQNTGLCGFTSADWAMPEDGLYESFDLKLYFQDKSKKAYIICVYDELAGFVLIDDECKKGGQYNVGEFFIIARFQRSGIGLKVVSEVWKQYPGKWELTVIPENTRALNFWEKAIRNVVGD